MRGRVAMQEASIRIRRRKAAASARAVVSEAARDDKQEEVRHLQHYLASPRAHSFPNGSHPRHWSAPRGIICTWFHAQTAANPTTVHNSHSVRFVRNFRRGATPHQTKILALVGKTVERSWHPRLGVSCYVFTVIFCGSVLSSLAA